MTARVRLPRIAKGYKRKFVRCKRCRRVYYYDFVPYSLSKPLLAIPCGHGIGARDYNLTSITEAEYRTRISKKGQP
jgi:hypothetical protein